MIFKICFFFISSQNKNLLSIVTDLVVITFFQAKCKSLPYFSPIVAKKEKIFSTFIFFFLTETADS